MSDSAVTVRDQRPIGDWFEQGLLAENVQLSPEGQSLILYDLTLVEDDGPGAATTTDHGGAKPTTIRGATQVRKLLHLERAEVRRAHLVLSVGPRWGETEPLRVHVNGRKLLLSRPRAYADDWPAIPLPASCLREGDNEVVLSCAGEKGWWITVAQREAIHRNAPERKRWPNRSFRSTDDGRTWKPGLGDDGKQRGELMLRLHLDQYAKTGQLIGPVVDLAALAAGGRSLADAVEVSWVRLAATRKRRAGTDIEFAVRSGDSPVYDAARWGEWQPCGNDGRVREGLRRFVQWRAVLTTDRPKVTPVLESVALEAQVQSQPACWATGVKLIDMHNEEIRYTSIPFEYERFDEPQLVALRRKFRLDKVVAGAKSELATMNRLRHWVATQWKYDVPTDHYPAWDTHEILDLRKGICVQYAIVLMQCALSFGLQTRFVFGYFPNLTVKGQYVCGHEVDEYWSNDLGKWVMMDPNEDECFLDQATGIPTSMMELHEEQLDTYLPDGIDGQPAAVEDERPSKTLLRWAKGEAAPQSEPPKLPVKWGYLHWMPRNNFYAHRFPEPLFQGRGWAWTGYWLWQDDRTPRQWRYGRYTRRRSDIDWTLNQVRWAASPSATPNTLEVSLGTVTPDFDTYLVRRDGGAWRASGDTVEWKLKPGRNRLEMRVRNRARVLGRVSWIEVERE